MGKSLVLMQQGSNRHSSGAFHQLYFTTEKAWGGKSGRRYQLPAGDGLPADEGDEADVWQNRRKAGISFCHILKTG